MAERRDADPGNQVQIRASVGIEQPAAASALEDDPSAAIDLQQVIGFKSNHVGGSRHVVTISR